jgi:hypothetical protein
MLAIIIVGRKSNLVRHAGGTDCCCLCAFDFVSGPFEKRPVITKPVHRPTGLSSLSITIKHAPSVRTQFSVPSTPFSSPSVKCSTSLNLILELAFEFALAFVSGHYFPSTENAIITLPAIPALIVYPDIT